MNYKLISIKTEIINKIIYYFQLFIKIGLVIRQAVKNRILCLPFLKAKFLTIMLVIYIFFFLYFYFDIRSKNHSIASSKINQ